MKNVRNLTKNVRMFWSWEISKQALLTLDMSRFFEGYPVVYLVLSMIKKDRKIQQSYPQNFIPRIVTVANFHCGSFVLVLTRLGSFAR